MKMLYSYGTRKKQTNESRSKTFKTVAIVGQYLMLMISGMFLLMSLVSFFSDFFAFPLFIIIIVAGAFIGNFALVSLIFAQRAKKYPDEDEAIEEETGDDEISKKIRGYTILYPKITLSQLAEKSGVSDEEIEDRLVNLMMQRKIKGHIDPGTKEFISGAVNHRIIVDGSEGPDAFLCPFCKADIGSPPVKGTTLKCESCGNLIVM